MCKALMPRDEESMSDEAIWKTLRTQLRYLPLSKMLDADITDSVIGEGCVIKNCKIFHSVVGLHSCISGGAIIEDTLLMGAYYYETEADKSFLAAKGSVPLGIGRNSRIKRAIVDKNARIGENVKADFDGNGTFKCEEFITMSVHMRRLGNDEHLTKAFPTMSTWIRMVE